MIIREIRIDSFGSLRNRTVTFTDGLNLVEGKNESGKTAMAAFIKFMLYGLSGTPEAEGEPSERERFINRETGRAAGVMEIEDGDSAITVERVQIAGEPVREMIRVTDADTGEVLKQGKDVRVGELLLGVPESVFVNTVYIGQMDDSRPGDELLPAIENLLNNADERVSAERAIERLEAEDRVILDRNDTAGLLIEKRKERRRTAADLTELRMQREKTAGTGIELPGDASVGTNAPDGTPTDEIERLERLIACGEICLHKQQFEKIHSAEKQIERMRATVEQTRAEKNTAERLDAVAECEDRIVENTMAVENVSRQLRSNGARLKDAQERQRVIEAKVRKAEEELARYTNSEKALGTVAWLTLTLALIALASAFLILAAAGKNLAVLYVIFGTLFAASICCALMKRYRAAKRREFLHLYGAGSEDELADVISSAGGGIPNMSILQAEKNRLDTSFTDAAEQRHDAAVTAFALAVQEGVELQEISEEDEDAYVRTALQVLRRLRAKIEEEDRDPAALQEQADLLEKRVERARNQLAAYDEDAVREAFDECMKTEEGRQVSSIDANRLEKLRVKLRKLLEDRERGIEPSGSASAEAHESGVPCEGTSSAAALKEKLALLDEEIEALTLKHEAMTMAIRSIRGAAETHRNSILPAILKTAEETMRSMGMGAVEALTLEEGRLKVMLDGEITDAEMLSGGTRDTVYIALRSALASALYENSPPPLIFDESFARMDENRLESCLDTLRTAGREGRQSIVTTCRERDSELMYGAADVNVIDITETGAQA